MTKILIKTQWIKHQEDLNQQTTDRIDQKDQKWNHFFQKTYWNRCTKLGESWKWNNEDIDQNTGSNDQTTGTF